MAIDGTEWIFQRSPSLMVCQNSLNTVNGRCRVSPCSLPSSSCLCGKDSIKYGAVFDTHFPCARLKALYQHNIVDRKSLKITH